MKTAWAQLDREALNISLGHARKLWLTDALVSFLARRSPFTMMEIKKAGEMLDSRLELYRAVFDAVTMGVSVVHMAESLRGAKESTMLNSLDRPTHPNERCSE